MTNQGPELDLSSDPLATDNEAGLLVARPTPTPPRPHSFRLVVSEGPARGHAFYLHGSLPCRVLVGSHAGCGVHIDDSTVASQHVALDVEGASVRLSDLGSGQGTRVSGQLVREAVLSGGEIVRIGATAFRLEKDSTQPAPAREPSDPDDVSTHQSIIEEALDLPLGKARQKVVEDFERRYVERLLARHCGNVTRAAESAGVARRYFQIIKARSRRDR